jgi:hypothetical protein
VALPPLIAPMPSELLRPIKARKRPIPQAAPIFRDTGMILTSLYAGVCSQCMFCIQVGHSNLLTIVSYQSTIRRQTQNLR